MSPSQLSQQTDYYTILGADPMAQLDQIEALFRELAIEAETTGDHSKVPQAVEAFKVLRDPQLRQQYDQFLNQQQTLDHRPPQQPAGLQDELAQVMQTQTMQAPEVFQAPVEQIAATPQPIGMTPETAVEASVEKPVETPVFESVAEPAAEPVVAAEPIEAQQTSPELDHSAYTPNSKSTPTEELKFKTEVLERHRRELLRRFYEKRRANMRAAGIAIGGLDTVVCYSYELLEFHLWVLAEKKWIVREESGALAISALGSENHEKNLTEGLITSTMG